MNSDPMSASRLEVEQAVQVVRAAAVKTAAREEPAVTARFARTVGLVGMEELAVTVARAAGEDAAAMGVKSR
jgi:hypothetical protein